MSINLLGLVLMIALTRADELVIKTSNGYVKGLPLYSLKFRINAWLGVPFAQKPVNELKFKPPQPVQNWAGVLNATQLPNSCIMFQERPVAVNSSSNSTVWDSWTRSTNQSEDCLYLNIYTPNPLPKNASTMIWIHGGNFREGSASLPLYDPIHFVLQSKIIVVNIQYRLGVFGFLYLNHSEAPGNQGLLDQNMAIKWVYDNIENFGGNKSLITLAGQNAGAISVGLHMLSPLSMSYFRNGIIQSGTPLSPWYLLPKSIALKRNLAILNGLGCKGDVYKLVACVNALDSEKMSTKANQYFIEEINKNKTLPGYMNYAFLPTIDEYFLSDEPRNLLARGEFKKSSILVGLNKNEGNEFIRYPDYLNFARKPLINYFKFKKYLNELFAYVPPFSSRYKNNNMTKKAILHEYSNWKELENDMVNFENLDRAVSDFNSVCPMLEYASSFASDSQEKVFLYQFTHRSPKSRWPLWFGSVQGDEIPLVFGRALDANSQYFSPSEKSLSIKMLKYWSNFVKFGTPNGQKSPTNVTKLDLSNNSTSHNETKKLEPMDSVLNTVFDFVFKFMVTSNEAWPEYELNTTAEQQKAYMSLSIYRSAIGYSLEAEKCAFWNNYLPALTSLKNV